MSINNYKYIFIYQVTPTIQIQTPTMIQLSGILTIMLSPVMLVVAKDMETATFKVKVISANMLNLRTPPISIPVHIIPQVTLTVNLIHLQVVSLLFRHLSTSTRCIKYQKHIFKSSGITKG